MNRAAVSDQVCLAFMETVTTVSAAPPRLRRVLGNPAAARPRPLWSPPSPPTVLLFRVFTA